MHAQWALDNVTSADPLARDFGLDVLYLQAQSELADAEDQRVIKTVAGRLLVTAREDAQADDTAVEYDGPTSSAEGEER